MKNHYKTLDVADGASLQEIKKAYKKKAQLLHPDRNPSANAHEQFIELNTAYQHLIKEKTNDKRNYNRVQTSKKKRRIKI
jgi:DnaJ-class molecular chaperone